MTTGQGLFATVRTTPLRRLSFAAALSASLVGATICRAAETPGDSDTWSILTGHGVPFQSVHRISQRQADGSRRVVEERRTLVEFLGQKQEVRQRFEAVVDDSFVPRSCQATFEGQSGRMTTTSEVRDGSLVVTCQRGDTRFERIVPLADRPAIALYLGEALAARTEAVGSPAIELKLLDEESWTVRRAQVERLTDRDGKRRFRVTQLEEDTSQIWTLAADGTMDEVEFTLPTRVKRRATASEAADLKYAIYADREVLSFAVDRDLPFPERLKSLTMRLTWRDAAPDVFDFEDTRQQIVRQSHDGNRHQLDLRLMQPPALDDKTLKASTEENLARYLTEDDYIRPKDPAIREQAVRWAAGANEPLEIVRRLTHEVSNYLQGGELIAETLSGPEVLACRKGKCTEYSTLLASLARSQNIPTRVALGMRMVAGRWVGHMWCEVWLGRWMPVDASADEVGGSPALLKLVDSPTVAGTQRARWEIAESLELAILDVEREPGMRTDLKTGVVRQTYTNSDFGCRLRAPASDWRLEDKSRPGAVTVQLHLPGKFENREPLVHFVAFGLPGGIDASSVINGRKTQFEKLYKNFKILADEQQSVGLHAGRKFVFRHGNGNAGDKTIKTTEFVWCTGGAGYLINLIAEESVHDAVLRDVESLLANFEILGKGDQPADAKP